MQKARQPSASRPSKPHGFSLIEVLVAAAVMAVLASLAVPSFATIARQYRLDTTTEELMASIQLARVEAMRLGQGMVIRRQTLCGLALTSTADWRCGWQVFADLNGNHLLDAAETSVQAVTVAPGVRLEKQGGSPQYIHIDRFGRLTSLGQRFAAFPENMEILDGHLICFSTNTRPRKVKGAEQCPQLPGAWT